MGNPDLQIQKNTMKISKKTIPIELIYIIEHFSDIDTRVRLRKIFNINFPRQPLKPEQLILVLPDLIPELSSPEEMGYLQSFNNGKSILLEMRMENPSD